MGRVYHVACHGDFIETKNWSPMTLVQARAWLSETLKKAERLIRADPATFGGLTFVEQGVFVGDAKLTIPEAARYPDKIMTPFIVWEL